MPQPIPSWKKVDFDFKRDAVLQRPKLAPYIAAIAMHWNEVDTRVAVFLAALLGGEAKTVISVYLALQSDVAKRATIDTVVGLKLDAGQKAVFQDIQKEIGKRYGERNKAIHGAWGISPQYPDDLVWYDIRDSVALFPELMARIGPNDTEARRKLLQEQQDKLLVYTEQDFKDIIERMNAAYKRLEEFTTPFVKPLFDKMQI